MNLKHFQPFALHIQWAYLVIDLALVALDSMVSPNGHSLQVSDHGGQPGYSHVPPDERFLTLIDANMIAMMRLNRIK